MCSARARVGDHHDQRGDRAEAAGADDPAEQLVGQQRDAALARRPAHQVGFGLLELERDRGRQVDEQLEPQDLERQQRLAEAVERRDQDEPEQGDMGRDEEDEALLDVVDDPPALRQAVHQRRERVVAEDQVGRLLGDPGPGPHRHRDVGAMERRGVVDAVAGDRHGPARVARQADQPLLLVGRRPGDDLEARQLGGQPRVVPGGELLADDDVVAIETRRRRRSRRPSAGGRR